ncbi:MAG: hypothetical protein M0Z47_02095 [Actinomycetota bacterium]|nr:hypothetical protein [Actinomycetota bacterium]
MQIATSVQAHLEDRRRAIEENDIWGDRSYRKRENYRFLRMALNTMGEDIGMVPLAFGGGRFVFRFGPRTVLKVGFSRRGMEANRLEKVGARRLPLSVRPRIYGASSDGLWLIEEYVTPFPLTLEGWKAGFKRAEELEERHDFHVGDPAPVNFGQRADGTVVMLDYESLFRDPLSS